MFLVALGEYNQFTDMQRSSLIGHTAAAAFGEFLRIRLRG